jgi:hypothetical protein
MKVPSQHASVRGYEGRDRRWNAFIQNRMDFMEKFEEVHEQQLAKLDDAPTTEKSAHPKTYEIR